MTWPGSSGCAPSVHGREMRSAETGVHMELVPGSWFLVPPRWCWRPLTTASVRDSGCERTESPVPHCRPRAVRYKTNVALGQGSAGGLWTWRVTPRLTLHTEISNHWSCVCGVGWTLTVRLVLEVSQCFTTSIILFFNWNCFLISHHFVLHHIMKQRRDKLHCTIL